MDNEQRLELHEEIKDYLKGALTVCIRKKRMDWSTDRVDVEIRLDGEYISSDTFETPEC